MEGGMHSDQYSQRTSRSWRRLPPVCVLLLALSIASLSGAATAQNLIRVMPLGDSLTAGYPLTHELSYRKKLRDGLRQAGFQIDYVGSFNQDGGDPLDDLAHQGAVGSSVQGIGNAAAWEAFKPDIVLLMAGTNDFRSVDAATGIGQLKLVAAAGELESLLTKIHDYYAANGLKLDLFVSSIPPMGFATGSNGGSSTVLETLPVFLEGPSGERSFATLSGEAGSVDETMFTAAFSAFLTRRGLSPNLSGVFHAADVDASARLSEAEYTAALKLLVEFTLNKYIGDYNNKVRALASTYRDTHFVDAGAQLAPTDYLDGTHPATQGGYDKLAPAWQAAIEALFAGQARYWVAASGAWADGANWSASPGGPGGAGQPTGGDAFLLQNDDTERIVTRAGIAAPARLLDLRIDAGGGGNMTLRSQDKLEALLLAVGLAGRGRVEQSAGGATTVSTLVLGAEAGSAGAYLLADAASTLRTVLEEIGFDGAATFTQDGGSNDVLRQLILGFARAGSGSYTLNQGTLSANEEYVGLHGRGVFTQNGGSNRVELKSATAGAVGGTLTIAGEAEGSGSGSYRMLGGALSAVRVVNNGSFDYGGGAATVADTFDNNGIVRVGGVRQLAGNLRQAANGQLILPDAFSDGTPTRLDIGGTAQLDGVVKATLRAGAAPKLGDSFDILTAARGIAMAPSVRLKLPLIDGKLTLRAAVAGNALRVTVDKVGCDDLRLVRDAIGQRGADLLGDVDNDGVVDVRDLAVMAQKLPSGTRCSF
jgi:lysophospholipase L1-like esterase